MRFTILGGSGFIGSSLTNYLRQSGEDCFVPGRDDRGVFEQELGHVIYCVGLTSDFRHRPFDTVRAHVGCLADILEHCRFESLLYLSSTRVYAGARSTEEDSALLGTPSEVGELYNLSKMTGESLCFSCGRKNVRVARLSNVVGNGQHAKDFVPSLITDAVCQGHIVLRTTLESAKDYIAIGDVVALLPQIARSGRQRLYNVASGVNLTNRDITRPIVEVTGCTLEVASAASTVSFPPIAIRRLRDEFPAAPTDICALIRELTVTRLRRR